MMNKAVVLALFAVILASRFGGCVSVFVQHEVARIYQQFIRSTR
jgi:hypothetical protein